MSLSTNLISYWKLDGTSADSVGTNNGTDTAITYSTANGKINQGSGLNGTTSNVAISGSPYSFGTGDWTVSFWARKDGAASASPGTMFLLIDAQPAGEQRIFIVMYNTGEVSFQFYNNPNGAAGGGSALANAAIFNHIVLQKSGGTGTLYVNGVSYASATNTYGTSASASFTALTTGRFGEGCNGSGNGFFNGAIDEVGIWSRALSAGEITSLYNSGAGLTYPFPAGFIASPSSSQTRQAVKRASYY